MAEEEKKKGLFAGTKRAITAKLDQDGNGSFGIEDIVILALKSPGVYINREDFLRKQFLKDYRPETVDDALARTPALAGISDAVIDRLAREAIFSERAKVSSVSAALGMAGGAAMAATIPADLVQSYGFTLRAVQKLLYLYGFPDIDADPAKGLQMDEQTLSTILLCLGVMNGVKGSGPAIKAVAKGLAKGVSKKLMRTALTKGTLYPLVRKITRWFGVRLTRTVFRSAAGKVIPVVGGLIGGGVTFALFKPGCDRLKAELRDTDLADPAHVSSEEEESIFADMTNEAAEEAEESEV